MNEITSETHALLTLSLIKGVGPATLRGVTPAGLADSSDLREHLPPRKAAKIGSDALASAAAEAAKQVELCMEAGVRIISRMDPDYPKLLVKTADDPQILFVRGELAKSPENSVAVIGTREPTEHGRIITDRLARFIASEGWSIVSGLALGCDTIAHEAAVQTGGHTVAVLAHGLQTIAPTRNRRLAERIVEAGGALISEYRFGQPPLPQQFAKRDRIQAGLARGVVMIQSDVVGGSLIASRAALEYDRWLAVPAPTDRDTANRESKIEANLLLVNGTPEEKARLLRCKLGSVSRLRVIQGRADYEALLCVLDDNSAAPAVRPIQQSLL